MVESMNHWEEQIKILKKKNNSVTRPPHTPHHAHAHVHTHNMWACLVKGESEEVRK